MITGLMALRMTVLAAVIMIMIPACDLYDDGFGAPKGLVVTKLTGGNIHLTWDAVNGAEGYEIYYRNNIDSKSTHREITTSCTITAYTDINRFTTDITVIYYTVKSYRYVENADKIKERKTSAHCQEVAVYK